MSRKREGSIIIVPGQGSALDYRGLKEVDRAQEIRELDESGYFWRRLFEQQRITIQNDGLYPIVSVQVDGRELLQQGYHLPVGNSLYQWVDSGSRHDVHVEFGTNCSNLYGLCGYPLWQIDFPRVAAGTYLRVQDWTVEEGLVGPTWYGIFLNSSGDWVHSYFTFWTDGTFLWEMSDGTYLKGRYQQGGVDTFGIDREVDVQVGSESDTLHLLEYERMLNVWIDDGGGARWVPHRP
jgi:hypothetical protein